MSRKYFFYKIFYLNTPFQILIKISYNQPGDSSVGRAMDCSSIGHVFNSHSPDNELN